MESNLLALNFIFLICDVKKKRKETEKKETEKQRAGKREKGEPRKGVGGAIYPINHAIN